MSGLILHLAEAAAWEAARHETAYAPAAFGREGFIHCSEPRQLEGVANLLFRGRDDLVILAIREKRLAVEVRRENLEGGVELFPHVYGAIPRQAVEAVVPVRPAADGRFELSRLLEDLAQ